MGKCHFCVALSFHRSMRLPDHQLGPSCHLHSAVTQCLTPCVGVTSELGRKHAPLQSLRLCQNYPASSVDDGEESK